MSTAYTKRESRCDKRRGFRCVRDKGHQLPHLTSWGIEFTNEQADDQNPLEYKQPEEAIETFTRADLEASLAALRQACADSCNKRAMELEEGTKAYPPKQDPFYDRRESSILTLRQQAKEILILPAAGSHLHLQIAQAVAEEVEWWAADFPHGPFCRFDLSDPSPETEFCTCDSRKRKARFRALKAEVERLKKAVEG